VGRALAEFYVGPPLQKHATDSQHELVHISSSHDELASQGASAPWREADNFVGWCLAVPESRGCLVINASENIKFHACSKRNGQRFGTWKDVEIQLRMIN
jgi:hypothetical protein